MNIAINQLYFVRLSYQPPIPAIRQYFFSHNKSEVTTNQTNKQTEGRGQCIFAQVVTIMRYRLMVVRKQQCHAMDVKPIPIYGASQKKLKKPR
jgi:uncharacterized protein YqkB